MRVPIDEAAWAAKGVTVERVIERQSFRFTVPGKSDPVSAIIADGHIELFPERSSDHVELIAKLGLNDKAEPVEVVAEPAPIPGPG